MLMRSADQATTCYAYTYIKGVPMAEADHAHDNRRDVQTSEALEQIQRQLDEGRAHVVQQRAQYQTALREVKLARAAANDSSWELADLEQRLRELNEQRE